MSENPGGRPETPRHSALPATAKRPRSHRAIALGVVFLLVSSVLLIIVSKQEPVETQATATDTASTPMLSVRRAPEAWVKVLQDISVSESADVAGALESVKQQESCVIVADGAERLVSYNPDSSYIPASTLKLIVAYAVLHASPPVEPFTTKATVDTPVAEQRVNGNLYIEGTGDPLLSTDSYVATLKTEGFAYKPTRLEDLADQIAATGVKTITGDIVGDGSAFDNQYVIPTWRPGYVASGNVGPVSGLTLNDGFVAVGSFAPSQDPAANTATVLKSLLSQRGVNVQGAARSGQANQDAAPLAEVSSVPVREVVQQMLTMSDNNTAEALLKHLATGETPATTVAGTERVKQVLTDAGFDVSSLQQTDGSGLDRNNRLSCDLIADVIQEDPTLLQISSTGGVEGTLQDRFDQADLTGRVHAKTGTLESVSGLAGEIRTGESSELIFVVLSNGGNSDAAKAREDQLVESLSKATRDVASACSLQPAESEVCNG